MNKEINASTLVILGALLISNAQAQTVDPNSEIAASVIQTLTEKGYIQVNEEGVVTLQRSVLDLLKKSGLATRRDHSSVEAGACNETNGSTSSPGF